MPAKTATVDGITFNLASENGRWRFAEAARAYHIRMKREREQEGVKLAKGLRSRIRVGLLGIPYAS